MKYLMIVCLFVLSACSSTTKYLLVGNQTQAGFDNDSIDCEVKSGQMNYRYYSHQHAFYRRCMAAKGYFEYEPNN